VSFPNLAQFGPLNSENIVGKKLEFLLEVRTEM